MGIASAWVAGFRIDLGLAVLTILGAVAAHAGANLLQDYFDYTGGIDKPGTLGGSGLLVSGILGPRAVFMGSIVAFAIAAFVAVPLVAHAGLALLWIALGGFFLGAAYAVPRVGLKYHSLGDVGVFFAFGVGITLGSYVIQTGSMSAAPLAMGIPFGFLVVGVLVANNLRDVDDDAGAGVRTLAVVMGQRATRAFYVAAVLAAFAAPIAYVRMEYLNAGAIFCIGALPLAFEIMMDVWRAPEGSRRDMAVAVERTARLALFYGVLMVAGTVAWKALVGG